MNEILEKVMNFINDNTYLLIGICIFLIFVLIGYLIDNSVKSKRVRKDIKNKDQVPENIKNEIIKEAINENKEEITQKNDDIDNNVKIEPEQQEKEEVKIETPDNIDNNLDENSDIISEPLSLTSNNDTYVDSFVQDVSSPNQPSDDLSDSLLLDVHNNESYSLDNSDNKISEFIMNNTDADAYLMNEKEKSDKIYKNDKKLSEILSEVNKNNFETVIPNDNLNNNIFDTTMTNIDINKNVEKNIEIEQNNNSSDELDMIMKKLSQINNSNKEEDNYTNIF